MRIRLDKEGKLIIPNETSIKGQPSEKDLQEIAERLYPDSFQDFSEASFASLNNLMVSNQFNFFNNVLTYLNRRINHFLLYNSN